MKNPITICLLSILSLHLASCQSGPVKNSTGNAAVQDSMMYYEEQKFANNELVDAFFKDFQEKNEGWTKTEAGHQKLKEAFKKKITTDITFAKACASYDTEYEFTNSIKDSESISSYTKDDGEEGEIKAFDFVIDVALIKPLYNGQREISVQYEIVNTIPSTIEEHWRPYADVANFCDVFDSFLKNSYDATLNLGCYILAFKEDKQQKK